MSHIEHRWDGDTLTIKLAGSVDTQTAPDVEDEIFALTGERIPHTIAIDCDKLDYISSAGLRVVLRVAKLVPHVRFEEVWPEVYALLETTGFDTLFEVRRAMRRISVEGCPVVGRGSKATVYRISGDSIVKVYDDRDESALERISHEREVARAAFIAGVPTAISYDVVRVGAGYGSVFELIGASSLADLLSEGKMSLEEVAASSVDLLRVLHKTMADPTLMSDIRDRARAWLSDAQTVLPDDQRGRLFELIESVPDSGSMVHGDFHIGNIMVQGDECLLIDMETISHGDAAFELAATYNTYVGRGLVNPETVERFLGVPYEVSRRLWELTLQGCVATDDRAALESAQERISVLAALRMLGHPIRNGYADSEQAKRVFATFGPIITDTLPRVTSLSIAE